MKKLEELSSFDADRFSEVFRIVMFFPFSIARAIVWGPSSKLLTEDEELQEYLSRIKEVGVKLLACKKYSDLYGVTEDLRQLGIEVKYMGKPLTEYLRDDNYGVITI